MHIMGPVRIDELYRYICKLEDTDRDIFDHELDELVFMKILKRVHSLLLIDNYGYVAQYCDTFAAIKLFRILAKEEA